jgi:hypothetical protein
MKRLLLTLIIAPSFAFAQYNVAYTVTVKRLKANADDCDGCTFGQPTFGPQDPVINIWTNDADGNTNTNCWIFEDDSNADFGVWNDIADYEIANQTGVNTNYINIEMSGHESDALGGTTCSPNSGDDAIIAQELAQQFDLFTIPENTPYIVEVNVANVYFAEIEILWDNNETGIDEIASGLNFSVYPNPTEGIFNINLSEDALNSFDVNIMDVTGRAIYSRTIGSNEITVDLNNQDAGMYFVHINAEGKAATRTLILK